MKPTQNSIQGALKRLRMRKIAVECRLPTESESGSGRISAASPCGAIEPCSAIWCRHSDSISTAGRCPNERPVRADRAVRGKYISTTQSAQVTPIFLGPERDLRDVAPANPVAFARK